MHPAPASRWRWLPPTRRGCWNRAPWSSCDAAVSEVEAKLGPVEILVSNAGITKDGLVLRMSDDDFMDVIDANLNGSFRVAKRVSKGMMKARWGRMIFISSIVGLGGQAGQANYAASKAGLIGMAKSFAKEFASRGITANVVCPGPIETDMLAALTDAQRDAMLGVVPVGRLGQGDEIAAAVEFLASDSAAYITGTVLPVDGGYSMG
ncbi:MAG: SDR family oxidoreductase [Actinobacteria bacterium]|nr:SDR family oxidoreductase [Actinomycetota bacterium]